MEQWCGPWRGSGGGWRERMKKGVRAERDGLSGRCVGEEIFEGSGQFIFRALFDPLAGEDEGGDGGRGVEEEGGGVWLAKKYPI